MKIMVFSKENRFLNYLKDLDQNDRKILRDLGVKFGRYHVYLHQTNKT